MAEQEFESHDSVVFLAMCWSGGRDFALPDIVFAYDWINRDVLSTGEMEGALNRLLAAGLITRTNRTFSVPERIHQDFDSHRKRRRRGRFEDASSFLKKHEPLPKVARRVRLTESRYRAAVDEYRRGFDEALQGLRRERRRK